MTIATTGLKLPSRTESQQVNRNISGLSANADTPAFLPEEWREFWRPIWFISQDIYEGLHDVDLRACYLWKKTAEPKKAYTRRVLSSSLDNYFADAVDTHAGLLSRFGVMPETPDEIGMLLDNVDGCGNDLFTFLLAQDRGMFRDECRLIFVDPPVTNATTSMGQRPKLIGVDILDVYAPTQKVVEGATSIGQVSIHRRITRESGQFGSETVDQFWVYSEGMVDIYEHQRSDPLAGNSGVQEPKIVRVERRPILMANGTSFPGVPAVWYSAISDKVFEPAIPPFYRLLELNLIHFNKVSELDATETQVNTVTPYRKYMDKGPEKRQPFITGPYGVVDMLNGGEAGFIEPSGSGMALANERIKDREAKMKAVTHSFLADRSVPRTATEALIDEGRAKVNLAAVAQRKESAVQQIFGLIMVFSDPRFRMDVDNAGGIKISDEAVRVPPTAQDIMAVLSLFERGLWDQETALNRLAEMGVNPDGLDIQALLTRIQEERLAAISARNTGSNLLEGDPNEPLG